MNRFIAFFMAAACTLFAGCMPDEETRLLADPETGTVLYAEDVTPTGLTLVCTRDKGFNEGEVTTGSYYVVEKPNGEGWIPLSYIFDGETAWTMEAYLISPDTETGWNVDWTHLYGELEPGKYRIGKDITVCYDQGDSDLRAVYAEFEIE